MAHLSRPFWGNTSKTIFYSSFLLCIHKVHVKTLVEASQPNNQPSIQHDWILLHFLCFSTSIVDWSFFWPNSLCIDFQRDWSLSLGSSGESREERANSIALFLLDIWVKRSQICSIRSWKHSHFSAFYKNPVTHLSSYLFPATVLTERCRGDDGTSLKSSVMSAVRLWCLKGNLVSGENLISGKSRGRVFWFFQTSIIPVLLCAYLRSDTLQKVWTTESLFRVCSLIWCDLWDLI